MPSPTSNREREENPADDTCCGNSGECSPTTLGRREFVQVGGLTAAMLLTGRREVMAGPFDALAGEGLVPADKKLSPAWIDSLYDRGEPLTATGDELRYIGMPINGIATGQVYLGGDGRLWRWNLDGARDFKKDIAKGPRFLKPDTAASPMSQGFALQAVVDGVKKTFTLDAAGFETVTFTNQYPMATVEYSDSDCPVGVRLQAYTPFVPLNRDDSSYPVIVMRYTIVNRTSEPQWASIAGWVENLSNEKSDKGAAGEKVCTYRELDGLSAVECTTRMQDKKLSGAADAGSIALGLFGSDRPEILDIARTEPSAEGVFKERSGALRSGEIHKSDHQLRGFAALGRQITLGPQESTTIRFALSWRFPNLFYNRVFGRKTVRATNHYATLWPTSTDASHSVAAREPELHATTQQWAETWYGSTLPHWFLERTFVTLNCVQTLVAQRVTKGGSEHYNFEEGVRCCPGNCTHVWHYAQGLARIFPQIERECRDKVEFGQGFDPETGAIRHRYTSPQFGDAIDGNCGTILRVLRESQMTADLGFLRGIWDRVRLAMDHVIQKWDPDEDGLLEGSQHNTLDEPWYGQVHWLINLYHASLRASAVMARQVGQPEVATRYEQIVAKGAPAMVDLLWNEEYGYFVHKPGPGKDEKHGSTLGCHIDQVLGDAWLYQVGLDGVLPRDKVRRALEALWRHNFSPDVGLYRQAEPEGRWYAAAGNAGLIMCTFPHGKTEATSGKKNYAGYLNECMTGFEWQVSAHMIWEGMVEEGLAIGKAIYDRYLPRDRNPYNEIECSDHYSRAMASYGAFLAACGYRYDGPAGKLGFGPRLRPEKFHAAFTTAEGWGRFSQAVARGELIGRVDLRYGRLSLSEFALDQVADITPRRVNVTLNGTPVAAEFEADAIRNKASFANRLSLKQGDQLEVRFVG